MAGVVGANLGHLRASLVCSVSLEGTTCHTNQNDMRQREFELRLRLLCKM